jgi:RNA polymerase sigma factor (sigma-70 family)
MVTPGKEDLALSGLARLPDACLLAQYRAARPHDSFAQIVARHGSMVLRTCLHLVGNLSDAEDAAQATFMFLAQRPEAVNAPLGVWLHSLARRTACDLVRSRVRRVKRERQAAHMKPTASTGSEIAADLALREELDRALAELPEQLREAVILRYLEGRKQEEAARLAGCPQGTLARRAMEGLALLRALLSRRGTVLTSVTLVALLAQEAQAAAVSAQTLAALHLGAAGATATGKAAAPGGFVKLALGFKAKCAAALAAVAVGVGATVLTKSPAEPIVPRTERAALVGHDGGVFSIALSADGKRAATASGDGTVKLWDTVSGQEQATLRGHADWVKAVAIAPNGQTLASGDRNGTVKIWDLPAGRERLVVAARARDIPMKPGEGVEQLAFSPDGQTLAAASWNGTVFLWDPADGRLRSTLRGHDSGVPTIAFLPGGRRILTGSNDRSVRLWDVAAGTEQARLTGHCQPVHAVACAPDGQSAASGSTDGTVIIWSLTTGTTRRTWKAHAGSVKQLAFAPDGRTLASAGDDWIAKLWDPENGGERATLSGHVQGVTSVQFSADGRSLATASYDRTAKLWGPAPGR